MGTLYKEFGNPMMTGKTIPRAVEKLKASRNYNCSNIKHSPPPSQINIVSY